MKSNLTRRSFVKKSAGSFAVLQAFLLGGSFAYGSQNEKVIYLPKNSELPVKTAAEEIAEKTGAKIIYKSHSGKINQGEIVLTVGDEINSYKEASALITDSVKSEEWSYIAQIDEGLLFSGSSSGNVCQAVLAWIDDPARETGCLSVFRFSERFTMWDNSLNQWFRFSKGFYRRNYVRDIARLGFTGMEINRYADPGGYHVLHRKFPDDSYAWYMSYAPALDAFVESSLTKGIYPQDELRENMEDLKSAAKLARSYGLKPGFVCYEPRGVAEEVFDRYPELRGSRIDHPGRSLQPRYSLDIANPKVLNHYAESVTNLMAEVPDLRYFVFWTQDSGAGLPFSKRLYFGPNGSYLARSKTLGGMAADFIRAILNAGRTINPEFEVIMKMDWEYTSEERNEIAASLPEGATLVHIFGGGSIKGGEFTGREHYISEARRLNLEPYCSIDIASWETEPIIGINRPSVLKKKFDELKRLKLKKIFAQGGVFPGSLSPFNITRELFSELIKRDVEDLNQFLMDKAKLWCNGDLRSAGLLVEAWNIADGALEKLPQLNWYHTGAGTTQGRWLIRPIVPDITLIDKKEQNWGRALFPVPWDIARLNIAFEGGIRMYEEQQLADAVKAYDEGMVPEMKKCIDVLNSGLTPSSPRVIFDQRDRYLGFLYSAISVRNLFEAQVAINYFLMEKGNSDKNRQLLNKAIQLEIKNTEDWLSLLKTSDVNFFRITEKQETPFQYKTPVEDFELKLSTMKAHLNDAPGPFLKELFDKGSERNLLFYN